MALNPRFFDSAKHSELYVKFRPSYPKEILNIIIEFSNGKKLKKVVDVCCGSGQSTFMFSSVAESVVGMDISENQIREAKRRNQKQNVTFVVASASNLPFEDKSIDLISCGACIHWLDVDKFFAECDRVLTPVGVIAVYCYEYPTIASQNINNISNEQQQEINKLTEEITKAIPRPAKTQVVSGLYGEIYQSIVSEDKKKIETVMTTEDTLEGWVGMLTSFYSHHDEEDAARMDKVVEEYAVNVKRIMNVEQMKNNDIKLKLMYDFILFMAHSPLR